MLFSDFDITNRFSPIIREKTLNFFPGKNRAWCKMAPRKRKGKLRRSLIDARARSCQRGRQHWSAAFPRLEAWILSKPVSTSASEISSQAGEGDFEDVDLHIFGRHLCGVVALICYVFYQDHNNIFIPAKS